MKFTPKRGILFAILALASVAPLVMTLRSKPKLQQPVAPGVEVVQVIQKDVPVYREWIGTLDGMVNAEIKAQVTGYLLKQVYTEGSEVTAGQPLFEIDPRPFRAGLDQAKATLAQGEGRLAEANGQLLEAQAQVLRSEANQGRTQLDVNRYTPLAKAGGVTEQDLDNAVQANLAAKAEVEAAKAKVETGKASIVSAKAAVAAGKAAVVTAELNLGFTKIVSPIAGIAGVANAQIGNLVNAGGDRLTTVSTMDPIKVYFTASEQDVPALHPRQSEPDRAPSPHSAAGPGTGTSRRERLSEERQGLFRGSRGRSEDRRHPAGWGVPQPSKRAAARTIRTSPGGVED